MGAIDFAATATQMVTDLTAASGPIQAGVTVGTVVLACTVGWAVLKRFAR